MLIANLSLNQTLLRFLLCEKNLDDSFTSLSTSFSSNNHLLHLCALFLILFYLTLIRISGSTHLLMCLSLETLMSIIRTGQPILVELIDLVNCNIFSISNDLTQMTNFPTRNIVFLTVLLFWIYLFLLTLVFVIQWLSISWEILMLLSQFH